MAKPTHEDAVLLVQLAQLAATSGVAEATSWLFSEEFTADPKEFMEKHPRGSAGNVKVSTVAAWYETVGTLYKHGLLNGELLFDWLAIDLLWQRLEGLALLTREQTGDAKMFENFEAMAKAQKG
jgi:hypothetical protein